MALAAFQPKAEKPEWQMIYEHVKDSEYGCLFEYSELSGVLGRDIRKSRNPIYKATKELEKNHKKTLINSENIGYRIAQPAEHIQLATDRKKKAANQLRNGIRTAEGTDKSKLTFQELRRLDEIERTLYKSVEAISKHSKQIAEIEERQETGKIKTQEMETRLEKLEKLLYDKLS